MKRFFLIILGIFFLFTEMQAQKVRKQGTGKILLGSNLTMLKARELALDEARKDAVQKIGVFIKSSDLLVDIKMGNYTKTDLYSTTEAIVATRAKLIKKHFETLQESKEIIYVLAEATFEIDEGEFKKNIKNYLQKDDKNIKELKDAVDKWNELNKELAKLLKNPNNIDFKKIEEIHKRRADLREKLGDETAFFGADLLETTDLEVQYGRRKIKTKIYQLKISVKEMHHLPDPYFVSYSTEVEDVGTFSYKLNYRINWAWDNSQLLDFLKLTQKLQTLSIKDKNGYRNFLDKGLSNLDRQLANIEIENNENRFGDFEIYRKPKHYHVYLNYLNRDKKIIRKFLVKNMRFGKKIEKNTETDFFSRKMYRKKFERIKSIRFDLREYKFFRSLLGAQFFIENAVLLPNPEVNKVFSGYNLSIPILNTIKEETRMRFHANVLLNIPVYTPDESMRGARIRLGANLALNKGFWSDDAFKIFLNPTLGFEWAQLSGRSYKGFGVNVVYKYRNHIDDWAYTDFTPFSYAHEATFYAIYRKFSIGITYYHYVANYTDRIDLNGKHAGGFGFRLGYNLDDILSFFE